MPENDLLKTTIEVKHKGETYEFRIPSFSDEIKLGLYARRVRRKLDPDQDGSAYGLDITTATLVRAAAVFETLLLSCTSRWPYSTDDKGAPTVDFTKWPEDKMEEAVAVGLAFDDDLARFRRERSGDGDAAGGEAVDGQQDS